MTIDLVLSRFNEDLSWAQFIRSDCRIVVYNKGEGAEPRLPNAGREAHTYLHHIAEHYDSLADWTFFSQGDPLAHCPGIHDIINGWPDSWPKSSFWASPGLNFFHAGPVRLLEVDPPGDDFYNDCPGLWVSLFRNRCPENIVFSPGSIFAATRERLMARSASFHRRAMALACARPRGPWEFERLWAYLWRDKDASFAIE